MHKSDIERYKLVEEKAESVERYVAEELSYEDSDDDDIGELLSNKTKYKIKTTHSRDLIAYHINLWNLHM